MTGMAKDKLRRRDSQTSIVTATMRDSSTSIASDSAQGTVARGVIVYLTLTLLAFVFGSLFPLQPKSRPVPTKYRTMCKTAPRPFDKALARGQTALITGAAGFVGSHVARYCAEELGVSVVGIDDFTSGPSNVPYLGDVRLIKGDLTNATFLRGVFSKYQFHVVYHLADYSGMVASHHVPAYTYSHNVVGTANLVSQAVRAGVSKFVMLSSTAVYGDATVPWSENSPTAPGHPYGVGGAAKGVLYDSAGISKLAAEQHLQAAGTYFGLRFAILRVHSVYGPRLDLDPLRSSEIARAVTVVVRGGDEVVLVGAGGQKRQFTFIDDLTPHIAAAAYLDQDRVLLNLGADEVTTKQDVVDRISAIAGRPLRATYPHPSQGMLHHVQAVHDKSRCVFVLGTFTPLEEGLRRTLEWARDSMPDIPVARDRQAELTVSANGTFWAQHVYFSEPEPTSTSAKAAA